MRIALHQYAMSSDAGENLERVLGGMQRSSAAGADLYLTPELCLSPFFPQFPGRNAVHYLNRAGDEATGAMRDRCRVLGMAASPNVYLEENGRRYDASLMIDPQGELLGIAKMVHICQQPGFFEQDYYAPSDSGFRVFECAGIRIGIVICFDRHFPESVRTSVLRGAQLILIPTANTRGEPRELFAWELRASSMQNGVYIASCNRVGTEEDMEFCGDSIVTDPYGDVVARAGESEELLIAVIDPAEVDAARSQRPFLKLRRPDSYDL